MSFFLFFLVFPFFLLFFLNLQACVTRWGSTALMVSRFLAAKDAVKTVLSANRDTSHLAPKWQDLDVLQALDHAISPLSTFTDILSGDTYVTSSAIKPLLRRLETEELAAKEEDLPLTADLKEKILHRLQARYSTVDEKNNVIKGREEMNLLLDTTCYLDPRYKVRLSHTVRALYFDTFCCIVLNIIILNREITMFSDMKTLHLKSRSQNQ